MDVPEDSEFSSPVEVKIELNESGASIPPCPYTWGETENDNHKQKITICKSQKNELYSDVKIKQEPSMDKSSCSSTTNSTLPDTDNQTSQQRGLPQAVGPQKVFLNSSILGIQTTQEISQDACTGKTLPTCAHCPEMKFVSETHLLAHNIDKHGLQVPSDLENTNKNQISEVELSEDTARLKCPFCNYTCRSELHEVFASHFKTHVKECGAKRQSITTPIREKPFQCTICEFKCRNPSGLTDHMRTHTGEKPFQCTMCDYKCSRKENLTIHIRTHSNEKPFQCTLCDFRCKQKATLPRHLRTHVGEKPYQCTLCDFRCTRKDNLSQHIQRHKQTTSVHK